jgi:RNA polymerase sigma factor (sigma-70 family)
VLVRGSGVAHVVIAPLDAIATGPRGGGTRRVAGPHARCAVGSGGSFGPGGGPRTVDAASFESWFPRLLPFAYNVGYRFSGRNPTFAEDVAQESLTRAYAAWDRVRDHPNLEAWVTTTAFRVALELSRQQQRAGRPDGSLRSIEVPGQEQRVADADELTRALRRLSSRQQQVLVWRFYFDQSVEQTAVRLGLTASKVKDATHEAVSKVGRLVRSARDVAT